MENGTTIIQKKYGVRMAFRFNEDKLVRNHADRSGENQSSVPYEAIDVENPSTVTVNVVRRYTRFIAVMAVLAVIVTAANSHSANAWLFNIIAWALVISFAFVNYFKLLSIKYTILKISGRVGNENIRIIHDRNHEVVYGEIKARWRAALKKLHGAVNYSADLEMELKKFQWLKAHAVISELEYQDAVRKINASREAVPGAERKDVGENKDYVN